MLSVSAHGEYPARECQQKHVLVAKTDLGNLLVAFDFLGLIEATLSGTNTELAFRVVTEGVDIAVVRQETGEVLSGRNALHVVGGDLVDRYSPRSVDAVHVAISLDESRTVLVRELLAEAALAVDVGAPREDLPVFSQDHAVALS